MASSSQCNTSDFNNNKLETIDDLEKKAQLKNIKSSHLSLSYQYNKSYISYKNICKLDGLNVEYQNNIKKNIVDFLSLNYLVLNEGLFSSNEEYEDINTIDLKYLLVPYFLGELCSKINDKFRDSHIAYVLNCIIMTRQPGY